MKKNNTKRAKGIVWAIDPAETRQAPRAPLAKAVKALSRGLSGKVMPFSVVAPGYGGFSWPIRLSPEQQKALWEKGEKAVRNDLRKLHAGKVEKPAVEVHASATRRELVDDVVRFARTKNAGMIAVNTRRLLSPAPFKVGGFAEALIGKSPVPVLAVSPKARVPSRFRHMLFATDFSPASRRAFRRACGIAAEMKARITLVHVAIPPALPYTFTDMPMLYAAEFNAENEKATRLMNERTGKRWCQAAEKAGVRCSFEAARAASSAAPAILRLAQKRRADLICMAAYRTPSTPAILGGTMREVLSAARTPVLEIHAR